MGVKYLDLKPFFDLKMVYPDGTIVSPDTCIGIHNLIIKESDYKFGEIKKGALQALFEKNAAGDHLITCEKQEIPAEEFCDKVHFFGFSTWGTFQDRVSIVTEKECRPYTIGFSDVKWNVKSENQYRLYADRRYYAEYGDVFESYCASQGEIDPVATAFMFCKTVDLKKKTYIKKIILPDDPLMYISAITLENSEQ